ncbi:MAG: hypothetical protein ACKVRN_11950 [Pyrinomonadaceae bacterium]
MRKFDDKKFEAFRAFARMWAKAKADKRNAKEAPADAENERNIFKLARTISERGYSRRRLRRASSIL